MGTIWYEVGGAEEVLTEMKPSVVLDFEGKMEFPSLENLCLMVVHVDLRTEGEGGVQRY